MRLPVAIGSVAAVLAAAPARADDLALEDIEDVETLSLGELLEQPVTAASKYAQKPGDSPVLVSAIDRDLIDRFGYATLGEALRGSRGVYTSNDRNYSYLGARGFSVPGDYNTRFALSIDDHRMNDAVYGTASSGAEQMLPMIAVERIELVRGGAWSVHGENALLGAIRVVTATGATRPGIHVTATTHATAETTRDPADRPAVAPRRQEVAGSYGTVAGDVDVFVAGAYSYDPGLRALHMPELATTDAPCVGRFGAPKTCDGVVVGGDLEEVGSAFAGVRTKHFALRGMSARRRKQVSTAAFGTLIGGAVETYDDRLFGDLAYTRATDRTDLVARVAADYYGYHGTYPYAAADDPAAAQPGVAQYLNFDHSTATWWTGELRGRYKRARAGRYLRDLELAASAEAVTGSASQANADDDGTSYVDRTDRARMLAVGAHVSGRAFDHVVVFGAVRGNHHPDAFGLVVNPQAGMVLDGGELGRIRANYSRGYRAANPYEQHYGEPGGGTRNDLEPEHSETYELSVERYLGAHARLLVVGFRQSVTNLIGLTAGADGTSVFGNAGGVRSYGVETELEGRWERLRLRASYTRQHVRSLDGGRPANAPASLASVMALARIGTRAEVGVESLYVDSRLAFAGAEVPQLFTTNLIVALPRIADDLDLTLGIANLFDERGGDPGSEEHRQSIIPHDPRTVWVRLSLALSP